MEEIVQLSLCGSVSDDTASGHAGSKLAEVVCEEAKLGKAKAK